MTNLIQRAGLTLGLLLLAISGSAESLNPDKPFAEKHVLLQVSEHDPQKFSLVLDIANNLVRHYGSTDAIDIQIVGFGGGAHLMLAKDNAYAERISSTMASDIRFVVCLNTIDNN